MRDETPSGLTPGDQNAVGRIRLLAERQEGRITTAQLRRRGLSGSTIDRWVKRGHLVRQGRGVFAVGHLGTSERGELSTALLCAGTGAVLSHTTGAWWRNLLRYRPDVIHVCAPNRRRSTGRLRIHHPATIHREWHRGLPVISVTQTLVQIAPMVSESGLRRALAVADRNNWLDLPGLRSELTRRPRGAKRLRHAIEHHMPELAETLSPLEDRFFLFCERYGLPLPESNAEVCGYHVDALWRDALVAVELDGREEHGTPAAVVRDRRRELALRNAELEVLRYGAEQVDHTPAETARDLGAAIARGLARANRAVTSTVAATDGAHETPSGPWP